MNIREKVARLFEPCLAVVYINGRWRSDRMEHYKVMKQFRREAGLDRRYEWPDPSDAYDRILAAAGKHGWSLECAERGGTIKC